jgi:hypothetical protein
MSDYQQCLRFPYRLLRGFYAPFFNVLKLNGLHA